MKRWGDRRTAVEVTERRELLQASEGDGWFLLLILRDAAKSSGPVQLISISPMKTNDERPKAVAYLFVLLIQISGAMLFVWQQLPEFRQIAVNPGEQLPHDTFSDVVTVGILFVMQISFWCRLLYIPIPFRRPNIILNHVFLFLCRLSFIFGSALFSIVVFRHLPELSWEIDIFLAARRGIVLVGCLFALFCTSFEVERLGQACEGDKVGK